MNDYLIEARISSLKQYLADSAAGKDSVGAWRAHKDRMGERYGNKTMLHTQHETLWRKLKENQRIKEKRMNRELRRDEDSVIDSTIVDGALAKGTMT